MSQGEAIAKSMRGDDGSGVVGAVQTAKAGKAMRVASGTFTLEELRAFGGVDDDEAVRSWFVEVKGVEEKSAVKLVAKLTALGKLGDLELATELAMCRTPSGG